MNPEVIEAIKEKARRDARKTFKGFVRYMFDDYQWGWANEYLCYRLQNFFEDYKAGKNPHLMLFLPPRLGKTELASKQFVAWVLGQMNSLNIMACSYASELAVRNSRDAKRIISSPEYASVFAETKLAGINSGGTSGAQTWETVNENNEVVGSYRAAGVGGGISGMGFDIGIIDDPVKDYQEASSKVVQERNREWFDTTFYTRRNPRKFGVIVIMTRWDVNDLAGQLLAEDDSDKWDVLKFPMMAEEDEFIEVNGKRLKSRKAGDILFPERMNAEFVESCRANPTTWSALYQQEPVIAGGNFFPVDKVPRFEPDDLPEFVRLIATADTAFSSKQTADRSVVQVYGQTADKHIYCLGQVSGRWEYPRLKQEVQRVWEHFKNPSQRRKIRMEGIWIENKASGQSLIQELRGLGIPCMPVERHKDKATRAHEAFPYIDAGMVHLPSRGSWVVELLEEMMQFRLDDRHAHDDMVDTMMTATEVLLRGHGGLNYAVF